jgi:hypothetical protein
MEFVEMEETMLTALHFRVNGPTPLGFVQYFMALIPPTIHPSVASLIMDYARYQTELAVSDQSFVAIKPSEIALAAFLNALEGMDTTLLPLKLQGKFVRPIEKYAEIYVNEVENTQSKLSHLLVSTISGNYTEIMNSIDQHGEMSGDELSEDKRSNNLARRNSPKSVMRR